MAYTIKRTNGNTITIEDNALNTTYGVQLIGKNRLGYGTSLNQNFFRLMENFSYSSAPSNPVSGQLWWDTAGFLKVYTGSVWKEVSSALVSEPAAPVNGDLWLDTVNAQLKAYNGTTGTWITVGPSNATTGILNGFVTEAVTIGGIDYYIATMYANGTKIAILSKDVLSGTGITGFSNLNLGLNFNTTANCAVHNANVYASSGTFTGNVSSGNLSTAGILSVTGNANVGNLDAARGVFSSAVTSTSTTTGAVVIAGGLGVAGNVNAAGNVSAGNLAATGAAITGNVSMGNISVTNISNLGGNTNVKITGGTNGQILSTDGTGNLAWINPASGTINTGTNGRITYYSGATTLSASSSTLTWNDATSTLSLTGNLQTTNLTVTSNVAVSGNLIYADATNSRIGVGTTSPSYKTHIYQVDTAFSGNTASGGLLNTNLYNQFLITPSSNPTVPLSYLGSWNDTSYNSSANGPNVTIISSLIRPIENGIGNVATMVGLSEDTRVTSSGNVTTSYGILTQLNLVSSGSVGTHYSLYISNPTKSSTGNLVTNYGLYLASQTTGNTTNWGIYSAGGSNYFGGNILVGTTTPSANLTVNGTSNLGPIGNITITGGSSGWVLSTNGSGGLSWVNPAAGVTSISNGTSNLVVANNGNVSLSASGSSNVLVISSASANITGTANISGNLISSGHITGGNLITGGVLSVTGNANVGNIGAAAGVFTGAISGSTTVNITGNANVGNIGATRAVFTNISGTLETAGQTNITSVGTLGSLTVSGNSNVGNLVLTGNITDTGPLVLITAASGNISLAPNGVTTLVATTTGANVTGTFNTTGNANVGNLGTAGNITASYFFGNGSQLTGLTVAAGSSLVNGTSNVTVAGSGNVTTSVAGTANVFIVTSAGANVTGTLNSTGNANVGNLGTAGNITASYFFGNGSQLTGLTVAAGSSLVNGTSNVTVAGSGNVTTSVAGTANVLVVNSGGIGVTANAFLATSSGSVGVGTSSPTHKLDVRASTARIFNGTASADTTLYIGNAEEALPGQGMYLTFHGSAGTPYASINSLSQGAGWRNLVLLPNGGNVGIGTTSPLTRLHVEGQGFFADSTAAIDPGGASGPGVRIGYNTAGDYGYVISNDTGVTTKPLYLGPNLANGIYINAAGNVGIGTTTPGAKLSVEAGNIGIDGNGSAQQFFGAAGNFAGTNTTGGVVTVFGHAPNAQTNLATPPFDGTNFVGAAGIITRGFSESGQYRGSLEFFTETANTPASRMLITHDGNVGIGTTTPGVKLQVVGGRSSFAAASEPYGVGARYVSTGGDVYFGATNGTATPDAQISAAGGSALMTLQNGGNVGIGTTSPGTKLHVGAVTVADGNVTLSAGTNMVYTTATSGAALTWNASTNGGNSNTVMAQLRPRQDTGANYNLDVFAGTWNNNNTPGTAIATFQSTGNVGIGTTTPTQKLHVSGTVLATLFSGSGASLTSIPNSATTATSANTGSAIVARDPSGDFTGRYINATYFTSSDDINTGTLTYLMGKFGDTYIRSATAAKVATFISGQSMNISGSATSVTNGVYTIGDQTIGGTKTFSSAVVANITGSAYNITQYTINQHLGTGNSPTFVSITATGTIKGSGASYRVVLPVGTNYYAV